MFKSQTEQDEKKLPTLNQLIKRKKQKKKLPGAGQFIKKPGEGRKITDMDEKNAFEYNAQKNRKEEAEIYHRNLETYLKIIDGFSSYDNLDVLQKAASQAVNYYTKLTEYPGYKDEVSKLLKEYRKKFMPCLQNAITVDGKLAVDENNAIILAKTVNTLAETMALYNGFDRAASDHILRGIAPNLAGFQEAYAKLRGDGKTPSKYEPYLNDILSSRYGIDGAGFAQIRALLGMNRSSSSAARQYYEIMDNIVFQNDRGRAKLDRAYKLWREFSDRYGTTESADDPVALLSGAGPGGQIKYSYIAFPANLLVEGWRNTFDFASQLVAANTFGQQLKYLSQTQLFTAVKSGSTLPPGTQAIYFGRTKFFERVAEFNFLTPQNVPNPLLETEEEQMQDALKSDFSNITSRYLSTLYYMQENQQERYNTMSNAMDRFESALYAAASRVDEVQNRVADPAALSRGSIQIPMIFLARGAPMFMPGMNAVMLGRLPYVSIFEGMTIQEITKTMSFRESNMINNFLLNRYYADEYLKRLLSTRMMEINTRKNYLHFLPGYESVLGELAKEFNAIRKNLADLTWKQASGKASFFGGEGRRAEGAGFDAQLYMQGINPRQTCTLEGFFVPEKGLKDIMGRGKLTQTEVAGANIWDLMGRIDRYISEGTGVSGITFSPVTNTISIANLDMTYGTTDGMCRANFWGVSRVGENPRVAETYYGTALMRTNGQWVRIVIDHDAIVKGGLKDALDHFFAHTNVDFGKGYISRSAIEKDSWDYEGSDYNNEGTGLMCVGQIPPMAKLVAGGAGSVDKETAGVASIEIGKDIYLTAMTYKFNDRDLYGGGWGYGTSGLAQRGASRYMNYRLYEKPREDFVSSTYIGAVELHADEKFRAMIFGGSTVPIKEDAKESILAGGELTTEFNYLGVGAEYNNKTERLDRFNLRSYGKILPHTDYTIYTDVERDQRSLFYGGITHRFGKEGEIGSATIFGTSNEFGRLMSSTAVQSLALQAKSLIDDVSSESNPTREQEVYWLERMRHIGNWAVRQAPEDFWRNQPAYQFGIGYSANRNKKGTDWYRDIDGVFMMGGIFDTDGKKSQTYSLAVNYRNKVGLFGAYKSDTDYTGGMKFGFGKASAGIYFSSIDVPGIQGQKPSFRMTTVDAGERGLLFSENTQTSAALSVGSKGSYKFHIFNAVEGEKGDVFGQIDVYGYQMPAGWLAGQEIGGGYRSSAFDMAMLGISQLYWKVYGGIGQINTTPFDGYYINIGSTIFGKNQSLQIDMRGMFHGKTRYWNAGLTYQYSL
ncbi:MAG: hypothetical protein ABIH83_05300 [Candidatus Micrarchaeota archaeon]